MATKTSTTRTNNSVNNPKSRYTQGGLTDRYPRRLGWWERRSIPKDDTDITITIKSSEDRRPDLIAYNMYGQASLMWVVLQFNNVVDIETELRAGMEIRLPTQRRLMLDVMNRSTGGNKVY
jgi:hypothetical protein